jgi:hypothetical protein
LIAEQRDGQPYLKTNAAAVVMSFFVMSVSEPLSLATRSA